MASETQTHCWTHGTAIVYNPFLLNRNAIKDQHKEIEPYNIQDEINPNPDRAIQLAKDKRFKIAYTTTGCFLFPPLVESLHSKCRLFLPLTTIGQISDFAFYFLGLRLVYDTENTGVVISNLRLAFDNSRVVNDLNISIPSGGLKGDFWTTTTMGKNAWECNPPRLIRKDPGNNGLTLEITFRVDSEVNPSLPVRIAGAGYIYRHRGFDGN
ncbi:hypothetical protein [Bacillus mycoides]|uniref:hypothetical protein n=1 Tax=Bacillus mycoides TaxID=1405 RepID=UPI003D65B04F